MHSPVLSEQWIQSSFIPGTHLVVKMVICSLGISNPPVCSNCIVRSLPSILKEARLKTMNRSVFSWLSVSRAQAYDTRRSSLLGSPDTSVFDEIINYWNSTSHQPGGQISCMKSPWWGSVGHSQSWERLSQPWDGEGLSDCSRSAVCVCSSSPPCLNQVSYFSWPETRAMFPFQKNVS